MIISSIILIYMTSFNIIIKPLIYAILNINIIVTLPLILIIQYIYMRRLIFLDVETTGLHANYTDRIIQVSCIEVIDGIVTGNYYDQYVNPNTKVKLSAFKVHGISNKLLVKKPIFKDIILDLLNFINNSIVIAHNARFDVSFLIKEFNIINIPFNLKVIDSLKIVKKLYSSKRNSLAALAIKFNINIYNNKLHNSLNDAHCLALIFITMFKTQLITSNDYSELLSEYIV